MRLKFKLVLLNFVTPAWSFNDQIGTFFNKGLHSFFKKLWRFSMELIVSNIPSTSKWFEFLYKSILNFWLVLSKLVVKALK